MVSGSIRDYKGIYDGSFSEKLAKYVSSFIFFTYSIRKIVSLTAETQIFRRLVKVMTQV